MQLRQTKPHTTIALDVDGTLVVQTPDKEMKWAIGHANVTPRRWLVDLLSSAAKSNAFKFSICTARPRPLEPLYKGLKNLHTGICDTAVIEKILEEKGIKLESTVRARKRDLLSKGHIVREIKRLHDVQNVILIEDQLQQIHSVDEQHDPTLIGLDVNSLIDMRSFCKMLQVSAEGKVVENPIHPDDILLKVIDDLQGANKILKKDFTLFAKEDAMTQKMYAFQNLCALGLGPKEGTPQNNFSFKNFGDTQEDKLILSIIDDLLFKFYDVSQANYPPGIKKTCAMAKLLARVIVALQNDTYITAEYVKQLQQEFFVNLLYKYPPNARYEKNMEKLFAIMLSKADNLAPGESATLDVPLQVWPIF